MSGWKFKVIRAIEHVIIAACIVALIFILTR